MLLAPGKEQNNIFSKVPVVAFCNSKNLRYFLVRAALQKTNEIRWCEPCGKKTCLVCTSIRTNLTFTTEAWWKRLKVRAVHYIVTCKRYYSFFNIKCGESLYVKKIETKFRYGFNNYKSKHRAFRKGNQKLPQKPMHDHYCLDGHLGNEDYDFNLSNVSFFN